MKPFCNLWKSLGISPPDTADVKAKNDVKGDHKKTLLPTIEEEGTLPMTTVALRNEKASSAKVLLCVTCLISLLCVLAMISLLVMFVCEKNQSLDLDYSKVCVPCAQIRPNPALGTLGTTSRLLGTLQPHREEGVEEWEEKEEGDMCCARNPTQYAALFKLILMRQEEAKSLAEVLQEADRGAEDGQPGDRKHHMGSRSPVSAHFVFQPAALNSGEADHSILRWKSSRDSPRSHSRGLAFKHNRIYIRVSGYYFVYCQILYNVGYSDDNLSSIVSSYVERHSIAYPVTSTILMKSRHTRKDRERDRHSSYVGGVYFLNKGDQLFVRTSAPPLVSHDDSASFFGLFRVGQAM